MSRDVSGESSHGLIRLLGFHRECSEAFSLGPRALVLDQKGNEVEVFWIDGYRAGTRERLSLNDPLLAVSPHHSQYSLEDAEKIAGLNKKIGKLQEASWKQPASREEIVKYAAYLRKHLPEAEEVRSHGFQDMLKDRMTVVFRKEMSEKGAKAKITRVLRDAGYRGDVNFFAVGRSVEVRPIIKEAEEAKRELDEMRDEAKKLETKIAKS